MYTSTQILTTINTLEGVALTLTHVLKPDGINHPRYTITKNDEVLGQVDWYDVGLYLNQNDLTASGINAPNNS